MRFISFNIGINIDNSMGVSEFIKKENPDIVAFQEMSRHFNDSVFETYKSKKFIEDALADEMPFSFFGPLWISDAVRKEGVVHRSFNGFIEQGNEIMSRFPIINASNKFYHKDYSLQLDWSDFHENDHPRALVQAFIKVGDNVLQVITLHGLHSKNKLDSDRTIKQCSFILKTALEHDLPTIIAGDFNLFPETRSIGLLNEHFNNLIDEFKIKSTRPSNSNKDGVVDYVFVNDMIRVNDFFVIDTDVSDHLPLVLNFDII